MLNTRRSKCLGFHQADSKSNLLSVSFSMLVFIQQCQMAVSYTRRPSISATPTSCPREWTLLQSNLEQQDYTAQLAILAADDASNAMEISPAIDV